MPRYVDHEQRRKDIVRAAAAVLADSGYANFSLRAIATRMGGSSTLVTHYFATREQLVTALIAWIFDDAEAEYKELMGIDGGRERLVAVLEYFLPTDAESAEQERIRIALLPYRSTDEVVADFFARLEEHMRALLRVGVESLADPADIDGYVSLLRAWVNGMALSVVEHPELWSAEQQRVAMEWFLERLLPADAAAALPRL